MHIWRDHPGFNPPPDLSADAAAEELERIRLGNSGRLVPREVVAAARPKKAPLHRCFEWDDAKAAESFRDQQARNLIRAIRVVEDAADADRPRYVHVRPAAAPKGSSYYQDAMVAAANPDEWDAACQELEEKLRGAKKALDELVGVAEQTGHAGAAALVVISKAFAAIDSAIGSLRH